MPGVQTKTARMIRKNTIAVDTVYLASRDKLALYMSTLSVLPKGRTAFLDQLASAVRMTFDDKLLERDVAPIVWAKCLKCVDELFPELSGG